MGVALLSIPFLLRGLGATAFGTWVLLQTFSAVNGWFSLADLGVNVATTRSVAERASVGDDDAVRRTIVTALMLFVVLGLCCAVLLAAAGPAVLPSLFHTPRNIAGALSTAIRLFAVQVMLDLVTEGCEACLEGLQRVDLSRLVDTVRRTAVAGLTAAVAIGGGGLREVALASLIGSILGLTAAVIALWPRIPAGSAVRFRPSEARSLLAYGRSVALLRPFGILHRSMDRLVVGAVLGPAAVALVEVATQLESGADSILSATSYAVVPGASWLSGREDRPAIRQLIERGTKYALLVTCPIVIGTAALAGPIVRVWVGPRFHDAIGLTAVAVLYVAVVAPFAVGSNILLGVGRAPAILRATAIATPVNLVATIILVHLVGVVGAFEASLLGGLILVGLLAPPVLRETNLPARRFLTSSVLPTAVPCAALGGVLAALLALHLGDVATLAVGVPLGGAVYGLVALGASLTPAERAELRAATRRGPVATTPQGGA